MINQFGHVNGKYFAVRIDFNSDKIAVAKDGNTKQIIQNSTPCNTQMFVSDDIQ